ncbi:MAG: hypothetical protein ACKO3I_01680, partial [Synechococcales cyanobacterium]
DSLFGSSELSKQLLNSVRMIEKEFIYFSQSKLNCRDFLDSFKKTGTADTFGGILNITGCCQRVLNNSGSAPR